MAIFTESHIEFEFHPLLQTQQPESGQQIDMNNKTSILILSCDKFSDLWDGQLKLLNQNWPDRCMDVYIITDAPTEKKFPGVTIISAGKDVEWSERLSFAIKRIESDYLFITLDDYYLIEKVSNERMTELVTMMGKCKLDYLRLFLAPQKTIGDGIVECNGLYWIKLNMKYAVNLYPGIWNRHFLEYTIDNSLNPWEYEVSLTQKARDYNAKCAVSLMREYEILDVVRKGKLLRNSAKYFRKHPGIYNGNRAVNTLGFELKLNTQVFFARHLPLSTHKYIKKVISLFGWHFFSKD